MFLSLPVDAVCISESCAGWVYPVQTVVRQAHHERWGCLYRSFGVCPWIWRSGF